MKLDNVVPIDVDTARLLARRQVHFRWFVALLAATYLGVLVPTLLFTPLPPLGPFVMLAILVVLAEHRFVLFGDETSMSASIIVVVASVFVFADSSPLAGPLLIGSLGGLYLPHLRRGSMTLLVANGSTLGIAAAMAAAIATGAADNGALGPLFGAAGTVAAYWYTNSVLIGSASAVRQGALLGESVRTQATSEWPLLILATATAIAVSTLTPDTARELLAVAIALTAFEVQLRHKVSTAGFLRDSAWGATTLIGLAAAVAPISSLGSGVALLGLFLVASDYGLRRGSTTAFGLGVIAAFVAAAAIERLDVGAGAGFAFATLAALTAITTLRIAREGTRRGVKLPLLVTAGLMVPNLTEAGIASVTAVLVALLARRPGDESHALILAAVVLALASTRGLGRGSRNDRVEISGRRRSQVASH